jgi:hypothetical protein
MRPEADGASFSTESCVSLIVGMISPGLPPGYHKRLIMLSRCRPFYVVSMARKSRLTNEFLQRIAMPRNAFITAL